MEAAGERTPPKAAGGPAQNMSSATLSPESPAPSYPFWRVTKVPFPSMDRDGQTTHQQQQQQQQVFREDARLKFKRIARMLPYGGSTFHIAHSSRVPLDFEPGQIIIGVNKRGLHFFRPKPKKYLNSLALRDILYVRVQGRSLFISAEVNNGDHMDYEFDCATANQIHSAMAGYIEASDAGASSVGTPRSSVTIQNLGEPAPATDDHLQYRSSQAVPISMQEHEEAVAMAAGDAEARRPVAHKLVLGQENSGGATQRKSSTLTPATMKLNPPFNAQDYEVRSFRICNAAPPFPPPFPPPTPHTHGHGHGHSHTHTHGHTLTHTHRQRTPPPPPPHTHTSFGWFCLLRGG